MVEWDCGSADRYTTERRLFLCSMPAQAGRFTAAARGYWGMENQLHWRLDAVFREDASRIRKGNTPAILATVRHLRTNLLEREFKAGLVKEAPQGD